MPDPSPAPPSRPDSRSLMWEHVCPEHNWTTVWITNVATCTCGAVLEVLEECPEEGR